MANNYRGRNPNTLIENINDEFFNLKGQVILDGQSKYYNCIVISIDRYLNNL